MVASKKSPKKRSMLKNYGENLPKDIKRFIYFYLLIPFDDPKHTKKFSTFTSRSVIDQTMGNARPRTF